MSDMLKQTSFSGACFLAAVLSLWTAALPAATPIDPSGIYLFVNVYNENPSTTGERDYLTINRNGDRYAVVDISRDLYYLSKLQLILPEEADNNSIAPPIEEFALVFTVPEGSGGISDVEYRIEPVVPFPRTTAYLSAELPPDQVWVTPFQRTISFGTAGTACLQADLGFFFLRRCYIKIF